MAASLVGVAGRSALRADPLPARAGTAATASEGFELMSASAPQRLGNPVAIEAGVVHLWSRATDGDAGGDGDQLGIDAAPRCRPRAAEEGLLRQQRIASRAMVRNVLAGYLEVSPESLRFRVNAFGRPELAAAATRHSLRFNIAHTRGLMVCAVSRGADVGVDVENIRGRVPMDVADQGFGATELASLRRLEPALRAERFFQLWTLKEAYAKACGTGLSFPPRGAFDLDSLPLIRIAADARCASSLKASQCRLLRPTADHVAAVCLLHDGEDDFSIEIHGAH
jgi:4'-phosphopantetheinyl transferase